MGLRPVSEEGSRELVYILETVEVTQRSERLCVTSTASSRNGWRGPTRESFVRTCSSANFRLVFHAVPQPTERLVKAISKVFQVAMHIQTSFLNNRQNVSQLLCKISIFPDLRKKIRRWKNRFPGGFLIFGNPVINKYLSWSETFRQIWWLLKEPFVYLCEDRFTCCWCTWSRLWFLHW